MLNGEIKIKKFIKKYTKLVKGFLNTIDDTSIIKDNNYFFRG